MKKTALSSILVVVVLLAAVTAEAQQSTKIPRIGYLSGGFASSGAPRIDGFRQGLGELGYVEGKNIVIESRHAEEKPDRIPALAAELVRLKVEVIVTGGGRGATRAAKEATKTIPIVMAGDVDPVGQGAVTSLARPGGNVTGLSTLTPELSGKQLELLKEVVPKLSRLAVLGNATRPGSPQILREIKLAADAFGVQLQYLEIQAPKDIEIAFRAANQERADALLVMQTPVLIPERRQVTNLAIKSRMPAIYSRPEFVEDGGLMSYATSFTDLSRRAATYVDKILKDAKPADIPVEQPGEVRVHH